MSHRKGMKIYRMESAWDVIEGDSVDLEELGFIANCVSSAASSGKTYRGYLCSVIGYRTEGVKEKPEVKRKYNLEEFNNIATAEGKTYAQLQLEETFGRRII